jgi:S1-C subfamily serine protease
MQVDTGQTKRIATTWALTLALVLTAAAAGAAPERGPSLGVVVEELPFEEIDRLGLSLGVRVRAVAPGSPAAEGGIEPGDIIIALDATPVYSPQRLQWILSKRPAGEPVKISVRRGDAEAAEVVELSVVPATPEPGLGAAPGPETQEGRAWLGIAMQPMSAAMRKEYAVPSGLGVLITKVRDGSPAAKAGLASGDVLTRIDRREIRSLRDVYRALAFFDPGETVEVSVSRGGEGKAIEATFGRAPARGGMPPFHRPFGHPVPPQGPGVRMAPPEGWRERMEELRDSLDRHSRRL